MKVYVLTGSWSYEGGYVLGVYTSEEAAKLAKITYRFDEVLITEVTLNQPTEIQV